ncbi:hypothetical protein V2E24_00150 [Mycoplasmopsis ciconiae]|uniref:Uncharacterized protein n=1 Tax=Mycoplasmopsis ciconiae TaxID=561067 RepID=A0ABU7MKD2_9BACT|nr:hypothetical protein [Mycoplasmopsis ciconiae]
MKNIANLLKESRLKTRSILVCFCDLEYPLLQFSAEEFSKDLFDCASL